MDKQSRQKKIVDWVGRALMVIALALIVYEVSRQEIDLTFLRSGWVVASLVGLFLLHGANVLMSSTFFSVLLGLVSGKSFNRPRVIKTYCVSNVYKYLPGNFMHYVGRNQIAVNEEDVTHSEVLFTTILDTLLLVAAALVMACAFSFNYFVQYLQSVNLGSVGVIAAILAGLALVAAVVLFLLRGRIAKFIDQYRALLKALRPKTVLVGFGACVLRLLVLSVIYLLLLVVLGQPMAGPLALQIIGLFVLSWAVGFLTPGAPGGLGVREAMMLMFLGGLVDERVLLTSTIFFRLICILGDLTGMLYSLAINAIANRHKTIGNRQ